jgi:hypothetical protein
MERGFRNLFSEGHILFYSSETNVVKEILIAVTVARTCLKLKSGGKGTLFLCQYPARVEGHISSKVTTQRITSPVSDGDRTARRGNCKDSETPLHES